MLLAVHSHLLVHVRHAYHKPIHRAVSIFLTAHNLACVHVIWIDRYSTVPGVLSLSSPYDADPGVKRLFVLQPDCRKEGSPPPALLN